MEGREGETERRKERETNDQTMSKIGDRAIDTSVSFKMKACCEYFDANEFGALK